MSSNCNHAHHAHVKKPSVASAFSYPVLEFSSEDARAVEAFRNYLRIRTCQPCPLYPEALAFLSAEASKFGLTMETFEVVAGKPIGLITVLGEDPSLPSVILNSHTDVVPVDAALWTVDPWAATMDEHQNIYGRGCQDMKSVGIQHLEAVGRLVRAGHKFQRTIHLLYVPDEEIGGHDGMEKLIHTDKFKALNAGIVLDEGLASEGDAFTVFYGERAAWWVKIKSEGPAGHGSRFIEGTAMEKLIDVVNKLLAFRGEQKAELEAGAASGKKLGDVTTLNLTFLKGGVTQDGGKTFSVNVIPTSAEAGFDIRIAPHVDLDAFLAQLKEWTSSSGCTYEFIQHIGVNRPTSLGDDNPYYKVLADAIKESGSSYELEVFPAATDSRYIRNVLGLPAFGFSPMNKSPILLHCHDEMLNAGIFLKGIEVFQTVISRLANFRP